MPSRLLAKMDWTASPGMRTNVFRCCASSSRECISSAKFACHSERGRCEQSRLAKMVIKFGNQYDVFDGIYTSFIDKSTPDFLRLKIWTNKDGQDLGRHVGIFKGEENANAALEKVMIAYARGDAMIDLTNEPGAKV